MGDNKIESVPNEIEEIISELSECREDERSAQNQMIQVVVTAGTVLTIIFGASSLTETNKNIFFHLNNLIFGTAFGFITSLGISNVIRYHYIQNLEDRLFAFNIQIKKKYSLVHWVSFSSPIMTRNPKHINNIYTFMHYFCYSLGTLCPILFCIFLTGYQYSQLTEYSFIDKVGTYILFIFMFCSIIIFFVSSIKAKRMYNISLEQSIIKRNSRINRIISQNQIFLQDKTKKSIKKKIKNKSILYFIYPKIKDLQKLFLIFIGYFSGLFFKYGKIDLTHNQLIDMIIVWIIIDFLLYQARYLWNDIRGLKEDIEEGKNNRLPIRDFGVSKAVTIAIIIIIIRVCLAMIITSLFYAELLHPVSIGIMLILGSSVLYEVARSIKNVFATLFLVSTGYMIRFFVGLWAAYPEIFEINTIIMNYKIPIITIILLILAYGFMGEFAVILPWTHEAINHMKNGRKLKKAHFIFLYSKIKERYKMFEDNKKILPLREKGKISDPWNFSYVFSVLLLSIICLIVDFTMNNLLLELFFITLSIVLCIVANKKIICILGIMLATALFRFQYYLNEENIFIVYICITQVLFTLIYFTLRYLFDPSFNLVQICKEKLIIIYIIFIGEDTWNYLIESKDIKKKKS